LRKRERQEKKTKNKPVVDIDFAHEISGLFASHCLIVAKQTLHVVGDFGHVQGAIAVRICNEFEHKIKK
jgi:hypothetical protein